jgi:hypothetical protein
MVAAVFDSMHDRDAFAIRTVQRPTPQVMVNNQVLFNILGGFVKILELISECVTANDATASTLQYRVDPTLGAAVTISGASASLASAAAGATVALQGDALSTAALLNASNANLGCHQRGIIAGPGIVDIVIAIGSTTGTWRHHIKYQPITDGARITAA